MSGRAVREVSLVWRLHSRYSRTIDHTAHTPNNTYTATERRVERYSGQDDQCRPEAESPSCIHSGQTEVCAYGWDPICHGRGEKVGGRGAGLSVSQWVEVDMFGSSERATTLV